MLKFALLATAVFAAGLLTAGAASGPTSADPATVVGSWSSPFSLPLLAIHATVLPNAPGKVLLFSSRGSTAGSAAWLWDEATGALKDVSMTFSYDMMCGGSALLSDGKLFVAGGRINSFHTAIFDPAAETWSLGPSMASSRYYPSVVELADGRALIFYGQSSTVEAYDPQANTITPLPASANRVVAVYQRLHLLPDGRLFDAGPEQQTSIFDPATSTWSPLGRMAYGKRSSGSTLLLPGLNKVLTFGGTSGGGGATNTAEIIDFSAATPQWRSTSSMHLARQDANQVLLPDGTVLAVGGKGSTPPKQAELFDPVTETWTLMAAQAAQRAYHSTALLLPDGRVLSAGDGDGLRFTGEVYSPPYLFKGARPTIGSVSSSSLGYGQPFTISTPDAGSIARVALIKPGPVSHGVNFDQRYVDLSFTRGSGEISTTSPVGPTYAPPGWYMLFVVNTVGVPSVASWVHIEGVGGPPTCTPAAPTVTAAPPQGPAVPAGTTVNYTVSVKNNDSPACGASSFDLQAAAPAGWQTTFNPPSLTIVAGATATTTMSVTSSASAPGGDSNIVATATKTGSPSDNASAQVTYTVAPSGGGSATFADDFNRATLGSNWQVLQGSTMSIASNELRNGAVAGLHRAVVPTFAGADQTVSATFASTSQSTGVPTFGLILRYQNPTNYYLLYRQAGGTSVLRIAKVVNGVTTVLGSASMSNPQVNVLFGLTAKAIGPTLTLTVGVTSVSATDTTFASGGAGILFGSNGAAISHRADDFSATAQ